MGFTSAGPRIWPVTPDWGNGVEEQLSWLTDVLQASGTAVSQHRGLLIAPRRQFSFGVVAQGRERRLAEALLAGYSGVWALPIWHDVQWLQAPLAAAAAEVPCETSGYDFVEGGQALLYSEANKFELVDIHYIAEDHLTFESPTISSYGPGSRLYPIRRARSRDGAEESQRSSNIGRRTVVFDVIEPCDWPVLDDAPVYLGHPVQDIRPDESDDPRSSFIRLLQSVDYGTSAPVVHDLPGLSLRVQQDNFKLYGRAARSRFRSMLYLLCGKRVPMWIPSWTSDFQVAANIAGASATVQVDWSGYTLFGKGVPNRRDLRIELVDGTVYYRRITNSVEAGERETLTLNAALSGSSIAVSKIRQISIMSLCTLGSDDVEIDHLTDAQGIATAALGWQAVVPDV